MFTLRPYQLDAVDSIYRDFFIRSNVLCALATGSGKTEIMMAFIDRVFKVKPDFKVCILLNKVDLLSQTVRRFNAHFKGSISVSEFCGTTGIKNLSGQIVIATIQSIKEIQFNKLHLCVIDEVHNFNQDDGFYLDFLKRNPCKVLGFTATPFRADGYIYGEGKFFEKITYELGVQKLIEDGFLVYPSMKESDLKFDTSQLSIRMGDYDIKQVNAMVSDEARVSAQVKDAVLRLANRKKCVWACASIEHAELVYSFINESKTILHSKLSQDQRQAELKAFTKSDAKHLVFITIVSEGFDYPPIDAVILMRPTRSPNLYVQTVGRALRTAQDKKDALILDYGEVVRSCGPLHKPYVKTGRVSKKERKEEKEAFKKCPKCDELLLKEETECRACDHVFKKPIPKLSEKPTESLNIFGNSVLSIETPSVKLFKHLSKAGNDCLKIRYSDPNILSAFNYVDEFFQLGNEWAEKKMVRRLFELGINYSSDIDLLISQSVQNKINKVLYEYDGKYKKVLSIAYTVTGVVA
jgi:DNA repair protein RadD